MLESSLSHRELPNNQKTPMASFYTKSSENYSKISINRPILSSHSSVVNLSQESGDREFQDFITQMILNLVAQTEAELIAISTITQKYKETTAQKN